MAKRKKIRRVQYWPKTDSFLPKNVHVDDEQGNPLYLEGYEALRLVDWEGLSQKQAAELMGVSGATLSRILGQARNTVAGSIANAWPIRIQGGDYIVLNEG